MSTDPAPESLDVLAVFAHPDDAEMVCGGTLARSAAAGRKTGILDLTAGESGTRGSAEIRRDEAGRAARVLGVSVRETVGLPDARLENTPETRAAVAGWIRRLRPTVVITAFPAGRHPDHRVSAELVYDACFVAGLKRLDADHPPHRPRKLLHAMAYREDAEKPTFVVDTSQYFEQKLEALRCYGSQFEGKSWGGEVFDGGGRPLLEQIRVLDARAGSLIRAAYGEGYFTRETMRVDDVAALEVSTF